VHIIDVHAKLATIMRKYKMKMKEIIIKIKEIEMKM
jgi:hypothetical protein